MKRTTALLLAMALLAAHILTLHQDAAGRLAPVGEQGHAVLRLARQAVHEGSLAWNVGGPVVDAYPSWAWIGLAVLSERLYWPTNLALQAAGGLSALALVFVLSRFSPARMTGVVAPLLLVVNGALAAAALSGVEWTAFALAASVAFLAHEAQKPRWCATAMGAAVLIRPEGLGLALALALFEWRSTQRPGPSVGWRPFIAPLAIALAISLVRRIVTGVWNGPTTIDAATYDPERVRIGLDYLASFIVLGAAPITAVIATLVLIFDPDRPRRACRAAVLGWTWCLWVAWNGGDEGPFWLALAPALPALYLTVQGVVTRAVDSRAQVLRAAGWTLFVAGGVGATLASKMPGDLGPIPLGHLQRAWFRDGERRVAPGLDVGVARLGKHEDLARVERLRTIGIFLRDELPTSVTVLTPWPGAMGYLSRKRLYDLGGRVVPAVGTTRTRSWFGPRRADVVTALGREPDYIVPSMQLGPPLRTHAQIADLWLDSYDTAPPTPERRSDLLAALSAYELIAVPVAVDSRQPHLTAPEPFVILRHRRLDLTPTLAVDQDGERFTISTQHRGHRQIVDLEVDLVDGAGERWVLRPTGEFVPPADVRARTRLMLYRSGRRPVELIRGELPGRGVRELNARLRLPAP